MIDVIIPAPRCGRFRRGVSCKLQVQTCSFSGGWAGVRGEHRHISTFFLVSDYAVNNDIAVRYDILASMRTKCFGENYLVERGKIANCLEYYRNGYHCRVRFLLFAFLSRALASALLSCFPFTSSSNDKRLRPLANNLERRGLGGDDELLVAQQQQHKAVAALAAPNVVAAAKDHRWPLHQRACSLVVTVT
uniref:Uncharacterized protein n=1 Tax=Oryza glumipatula TaxID=40148 RepID=A0A0E0B2R2_9ORYZ